MMVHGKISKKKENVIYRMLIDLDRLLKGNLTNLSPLLSLYGPFDQQKNVIFPVSNLFILILIFF